MEGHGGKKNHHRRNSKYVKVQRINNGDESLELALRAIIEKILGHRLCEIPIEFSFPHKIDVILTFRDSNSSHHVFLFFVKNSNVAS